MNRLQPRKLLCEVDNIPISKMRKLRLREAIWPKPHKYYSVWAWTELICWSRSLCLSPTPPHSLHWPSLNQGPEQRSKTFIILAFKSSDRCPPAALGRGEEDGEGEGPGYSLTSSVRTAIASDVKTWKQQQHSDSQSRNYLCNQEKQRKTSF